MKGDDLRALLGRLERATGPNRELDEAIHFAMRPDDPWGQAIREGRSLVMQDKPDTIVEVPGLDSRMSADGWATMARVPGYTASLDAAVALVERVLPPIKAFAPGSPPSSGWKINLYRGMTPTGDSHASWECCIRPHAGAERWHPAPTPALAVLCAFVSALIARTEPSPDA